MDPQHYQDPGWLGTITVVGRGANGVTRLRQVFLFVCLGAPGLIAFLLPYLIEDMGYTDLAIAGGLLTYGLVGVVGARWATNRPLGTTDEGGLAGSYATNFFVGFVLSEAPLLVGFVFCFVRQERWPYYLCLPLYLVGLAIIAPTRGNLERRQRDVHAQGSDLSLGAALSRFPGNADK